MAKELLFYITRAERLAMIEGIDVAGYYITKNSRAALVAYSSILRAAIDITFGTPQMVGTVCDVLRDAAEHSLCLHDDLLERNLIHKKEKL